MSEPITTPYKVLDFETQIISEQRQGCVKLYENHLQFFVDFYCREEDEDDKLGITKSEDDVWRYCHIAIMRDKIQNIEMQRDHKRKRWSVYVAANETNSISMWYEEDQQQEAKTMYFTIMDWLFSL